MERANNPGDVWKRWENYQMPQDMAGKMFLDVGCWAGGFCREATRRGATFALGIDSVPSPIWKDTIREKYLIMDVFNPNFLGLPVCDVVLCAGVLYHVSDPVGLLRRLRMQTGKLLVLETAIVLSTDQYDSPMLMYCPEDSFDNNPSNWFLPNTAFLEAIMPEVGFEVEKMVNLGGRVCLHLTPKIKISDKLLPRKSQYMRN